MIEISLKTLKLMRLNALTHYQLLKGSTRPSERKEILMAEIHDLLLSLEQQIRKIEEKHEYTEA